MKSVFFSVILCLVVILTTIPQLEGRKASKPANKSQTDERSSRKHSKSRNEDYKDIVKFLRKLKLPTYTLKVEGLDLTISRLQFMKLRDPNITKTVSMAGTKWNLEWSSMKVHGRFRYRATYNDSITISDKGRFNISAKGGNAGVTLVQERGPQVQNISVCLLDKDSLKLRFRGRTRALYNSMSKFITDSLGVKICQPRAITPSPQKQSNNTSVTEGASLINETSVTQKPSENKNVAKGGSFTIVTPVTQKPSEITNAPQEVSVHTVKPTTQKPSEITNVPQEASLHIVKPTTQKPSEITNAPKGGSLTIQRVVTQKPSAITNAPKGGSLRIFHYSPMPTAKASKNTNAPQGASLTIVRPVTPKPSEITNAPQEASLHIVKPTTQKPSEITNAPKGGSLTIQRVVTQKPSAITNAPNGGSFRIHYYTMPTANANVLDSPEDFGD